MEGTVSKTTIMETQILEIDEPALPADSLTVASLSDVETIKASNVDPVLRRSRRVTLSAQKMSNNDTQDRYARAKAHVHTYLNDNGIKHKKINLHLLVGACIGIAEFKITKQAWMEIAEDSRFLSMLDNNQLEALYVHMRRFSNKVANVQQANNTNSATTTSSTPTSARDAVQQDGNDGYIATSTISTRELSTRSASNMNQEHVFENVESAGIPRQDNCTDANQGGNLPPPLPQQQEHEEEALSQHVLPPYNLQQHDTPPPQEPDAATTSTLYGECVDATFVYSTNSAGGSSSAGRG